MFRRSVPISLNTKLAVKLVSRCLGVLNGQHLFAILIAIPERITIVARLHLPRHHDFCRGALQGFRRPELERVVHPPMFGIGLVE